MAEEEGVLKDNSGESWRAAELTRESMSRSTFGI